MISIDLSEWSELRPEDEPRLRGLRILNPKVRRVVDELTRRRAVEFTAREDGLGIRSFSFVGRVELSDLVVTIRPKLAAQSLLSLIRYAYSLQDLRLVNDAGFSAGPQGLQDLLIAQLHAEALQLLRGGLIRRYVSETEELSSPRGRIEFARMARQPHLGTTVPCTHHPRSSDFVLNRVVRAGLELARGLASTPSLRRGVAQVAEAFAELARPARLDTDLLLTARRHLDRLSSAYRPAVDLVELLYESTNLSLEEAPDLRLRGFLFDMNRFFQTLIGKFLRESLDGCRVHDEVALRRMMAFAPGFNPRGRKPPRPRPDFVVTRARTEKFLLDAKYRDLWRRDLPREMLYQLAVYAMSQPVGATAAILYPTEALEASEAIIDISEPTSAQCRAHVALRPVVIPRLLALIESKGAHQEREMLAQSLAFGTRTPHSGWQATG